MKTFNNLAILLAAAGTAFAHPTTKPKTPKSRIDDIAILQYALTLEHLESKFYREGLSNFTLAHFQAAGFNETLYNNLQEISADETTHVSFLTTALKGLNATPVAECTYAFGVTSVSSFLATASILEGVGVSAYLGAAASIADKAYLTAAGAILTVESRHSAYLRGAGLAKSPFPQAFDAPLGFNEVHTLAAPFIASCPPTNAALPVKAFPMLALDAAASPVVHTNASIALQLKEPLAAPKHGAKYFAAWVGVTGATFVPAALEGNTRFLTTVPVGFHGQSYVVITKEEGKVVDDCVVAGPAIVEVEGAAGDEVVV